MAATDHENHTLRILDAFGAGLEVSQRSLASELGIALGLTNLLIKGLVRHGCVRIIHIKPNRVRYFVTPAGIAEKTRMTRAYLERSVQFYREARERIRQQFAVLSSTWPADAQPGEKRIVFHGAGEVAEIGYVCVGETDLRLVGVVDDTRAKPFFGLTVHRTTDIRQLTLEGKPFDRLVVMSFGNPDDLLREIRDLGLPPERVFFL
ncbi:MAG: hypothetical protein M3R55_01570 [Acidobacteriota bacterium]|nr:hypothetical protein [Acidobacteriota bacterium]